MRIAMFHELHKGGARKSVNETAKHLKAQHIVDLYYVDGKESKIENKNFSHVYFFKFSNKVWKGNNWKVLLYKDTIELLKIRKLHKKIAQIINSNTYDVIIVHPSKFTQAAFILRYLHGNALYYCHESLRMVYEPILFPHDLWLPFLIYEKGIRKIRKWIDVRNINSVTTILTNSKF